MALAAGAIHRRRHDPLRPVSARARAADFRVGTELGLRAAHEHAAPAACGRGRARRRALLLPAYPGAGKSTLAASLAARDWRLLSDEFGCRHADGGAPCCRLHVRPRSRTRPSTSCVRLRRRRRSAPSFRIPAKARSPTCASRVHRGKATAGASAHRHGRVSRVPGGRGGLRARVWARRTLSCGSRFTRSTTRSSGARALPHGGRPSFGRCACHALRYGDLADAHAALDHLTLGRPSRREGTERARGIAGGDRGARLACGRWTRKRGRRFCPARGAMACSPTSPAAPSDLAR